MALMRPAYIVTLGPEDSPRELRVVVHHQDQLRAELELNRKGIDMRGAALHLSTAFCWAALKRMGEYPGNFDTFAHADMLGMEDGGAEPVGPTPRAADTEQPSPSPSPTPEPPSTGG